MAHGITDRDNLFVTREPAWHGLGTVFEDYPTRAEAQKLAHPWEPIQEPIFAQTPVISDHLHGEECEPGCDIHDDISTAYDPIDGFQRIVRSDNEATLGVVRDTYQPVTNTEMYDIAEALEGEAKGSVKFETAGSLFGGSKVWILLRLRDPLKLKGDEETATIPYYALQNNHDGLGSFRGQATMTRIVCDNTARAADLDARSRGLEVTFRHTRSIGQRMEEARNALGKWREAVQEYSDMAEFLASEQIHANAEIDFVERFIPMPAAGTATDRVMANVEEARGTWLGMYRSETTGSLERTRWGLVQTSIEYLNWGRRAHSAESRFRRSYLTEDAILPRAVTLARAV